MPLFKNHHDAPVDTTGPNYPAGGPNDPAYNGPNSAGYPSQQGAYTGEPQSTTQTNYPSGGGAPMDNSYGAQNTTHPSGVGAPVDNSYGNQTTAHHGHHGHHGHPGAATAGGAATGAVAGHELGGHAGPGAAVGGLAGNHASHEHNQAAGGYNNNTTGGYNGAGGYSGAGTGIGAGTGADYNGNQYNDGRAGQTGVMNSNAGQPGAMTGQTMDPKAARSLEMKGKAQELAGMILSSQSMKAKGAAKVEEASAIRQQTQHLTQAERHEAAARQAREQAVAHGAHPDHGELGGARTTY